ncbi:MAG: hypothetical protein PVG41_02740 [Desulfobacteraceae bacterium]
MAPLYRQRTQCQTRQTGFLPKGAKLLKDWAQEEQVPNAAIVDGAGKAGNRATVGFDDPDAVIVVEIIGGNTACRRGSASICSAALFFTHRLKRLRAQKKHAARFAKSAASAIFNRGSELRIETIGIYQGEGVTIVNFVQQII